MSESTEMMRHGITKDAWKLVHGAVRGLDPDIFYEYVEGIEDTELLEMGYLDLANSFLEFVYETIP